MEKLPVIQQFCRTLDNVIISKTNLSTRFQLSRGTQVIFPDLQERLEREFIREYGALNIAIIAAQDYLTEYRARRRPELRKLIKLEETI